MTPARTSPVPAVASAGAPPGLTATRPSGSAISVSSPFSTTIGPGGARRLSDMVKPPRVDLGARYIEQSAELAGVRGQDRRRATPRELLEPALGCVRVESVSIEHERHVRVRGNVASELLRSRQPTEPGSEHERLSTGGALDGEPRCPAPGAGVRVVRKLDGHHLEQLGGERRRH